MGAHMKLSLLLAPFVFLAATAFAEPLAPINLWPGTAPGEKGDLPPEADQTKPTDGKPSGKAIIRLGNVTVPTLTVYPAPKEKATGAAVIVCPGGGYNILALDLEGSEICEWLNTQGVTAILLKYRVPRRKELEKHVAPLQDAQRAVGIVRSKAKEWGIDAKKIGILGFSAGGHLAAAASTNFDERTYPVVDDADKESCRPDFTVLVYPAYLVQDKSTELAPEIKVTEKTPRAFVVMTQDDAIRVENALFYSLALKNNKVPCELHVYPTGGHGYGLRPRAEHGVSSWPALLAEWMKLQQLTAPRP